eukprot:TRINITY_DN1353_c0_g1_i2.p1 TRINITY_DN1353_c0_g1~~TRINITY_DN1353_c0_g1_i2.p1  ORF type:complete len:246 (+),score=40.50 TRINITY_DN1353_c0_g1_i2:29-739(+)
MTHQKSIFYVLNVPNEIVNLINYESRLDTSRSSFKGRIKFEISDDNEYTPYEFTVDDPEADDFSANISFKGCKRDPCAIFFEESIKSLDSSKVLSYLDTPYGTGSLRKNGRCQILKDLKNRRKPETKIEAMDKHKRPLKFVTEEDKKDTVSIKTGTTRMDETLLFRYLFEYFNLQSVWRVSALQERLFKEAKGFPPKSQIQDVLDNMDNIQKVPRMRETTYERVKDDSDEVQKMEQ